jgi:hypothetical protein
LTRHCCIALFAATVMAAGCGDSPSSMTGPTAQGISGVPSSTISDSTGGRLSLRECSGTTFVGPIRLPISVHGTTITMSWLGSDDAVRGYELEFQRSDASNGFIFAMHDTVVKPEATEFLKTGGTYRVHVRGLFCNNGIGPWTDWVVFSTDSEDQDTPASPATTVDE